MATDTPNQHLPVIAKDLLIAALEAKQLHLRGATAAASAADLGDAYVALLGKLKGDAQPPKP